MEWHNYLSVSQEIMSILIYLIQMFASIFADESQFLQNNFSTASHLGYNNKFKEAVLAEAMRDEREQLSIKMKFDELEKKKRQYKLRKAIDHREGLPEEDIDFTLRKAEDHRREIQVERLRHKMKAVCGPGGSDLKRKKIILPYSPNASINGGSSVQQNRLYHSVQSSPKHSRHDKMEDFTGQQRESTLSTNNPNTQRKVGDSISTSEDYHPSVSNRPQNVSLLQSIQSTPIGRKIQLRGVNGKVGPQFNHTLITANNTSSFINPSASQYEQGLNTLKKNRERIVELNLKDTMKPPHRVSATLAAYIDSPINHSSLLLGENGPQEKQRSSLFLEQATNKSKITGEVALQKRQTEAIGRENSIASTQRKGTPPIRLIERNSALANSAQRLIIANNEKRLSQSPRDLSPGSPEEAQAERSFFNNKLKKQATIMLSPEQELREKGESPIKEDIHVNLFPPELAQKQEFQNFMNAKYAQMLRAQERSVVQIMKTPKMQRNERDIYVMMEFFCKHEFLKYQEPAHRYYRELLNLCTLRVYPAPGEELAPEDERFTQQNARVPIIYDAIILKNQMHIPIQYLD